MAEKDAYSVLMERHGYTNSERYRRILEHLVTPQQAKIAVELPAPPEELAQKLNMDVLTVNSELDELYAKGVIFPRNFETKEGYRFARMVLQLHDASQSSLKTDPVKERRLYELWEDFCHTEWYPDMAKGTNALDVPLTRVIPSYRAIKDIPGLMPCEDMREILKAAQLIAVCACSCRKRATAVGNPCEKSGVENCIQFNRGAEYVISRGSGRKLSYDEALAVIDSTEEHGLVHTWANSTTMPINTLCNCCRDCCVLWVPLDENNVHISKRWEKSRFEVRLDLDLCNGCQDCVERCQFDAIEMVKPEGSKKYKAAVDLEKCWGCGVCVVGCASGALRLELVRPPEHIPAAT